MLPAVISHRLVLAPEAMLEGVTTQRDRRSACSIRSRCLVERAASLRHNALLLVSLAAVIAMVGDWSADPVCGLWRLPAALLLLGLAYESWIVSKSGLRFDVQAPERCSWAAAPRSVSSARQGLRRNLDIELAPSAPDSFEIDSAVIPLRVPPDAPACRDRGATPTRLGSRLGRRADTRSQDP